MIFGRSIPYNKGDCWSNAADGSIGHISFTSVRFASLGPRLCSVYVWIISRSFVFELEVYLTSAVSDVSVEICSGLATLKLEKN